MRMRMRGRLVTAIIAAGLVGGLALGNPSAQADPEIAPPPAPVDPAAALPAAARSVCGLRRRRSARPAASGSARGPAASRSAAPPAPTPFAPPARCCPSGRSAHRDPGGHARRPEPDAVHRTAGVRAADVQPDNGSKVGAAKPIYINFARPIADRQCRAGDPHLFGPPVPGRFYWPATARCAGGRRTSGPPAPSSTSTRAAPSRALPFPSNWWPPSMTRRIRDGRA